MISRLGIYSIGLVVFLTGCASQRVNSPALLKSQKAYEAIRNNEQLQRYAPASLFQAGKLYNLSQAPKSDLEANHLAYLLKQEILVAQEAAKVKMLEEKIPLLREEKTRVTLSHIQAEVRRAQEEVRQAREVAVAAQARESALAQQYAQLQELHAQMTNRGLVLTLGDVLFSNNEARLMASAARAMEKLVSFLQEHETRKVLIEGHTDNVGNTMYNIDLSLRRAQAVAEALTFGGIDAARIVTRGYGEAYPVAENESTEGRQQNRRVEIVILNEGDSMEDVSR